MLLGAKYKLQQHSDYLIDNSIFIHFMDIRFNMFVSMNDWFTEKEHKLTKFKLRRSYSVNPCYPTIEDYED